MIQIDELIKEAMHSKDMQLLGIYKLIKAEFLKKSTEPGRASKELTDDEQIKVLMKMAAARKDSIEQYEKAGRNDLADVEKNELTVINKFLPKEPTYEDIQIEVTKAETWIKDKKDGGYLLSMKDMKDVMNFVKEKYPTVNGGMVSKILKEIIEKQG